MRYISLRSILQIKTSLQSVM